MTGADPRSDAVAAIVESLHLHTSASDPLRAEIEAAIAWVRTGEGSPPSWSKREASHYAVSQLARLLSPCAPWDEADVRLARWIFGGPLRERLWHGLLDQLEAAIRSAPAEDVFGDFVRTMTGSDGFDLEAFVRDAVLDRMLSRAVQVPQGTTSLGRFVLARDFDEVFGRVRETKAYFGYFALLADHDPERARARAPELVAALEEESEGLFVQSIPVLAQIDAPGYRDVLLGWGKGVRDEFQRGLAIAALADAYAGHCPEWVLDRGLSVLARRPKKAQSYQHRDRFGATHRCGLALSLAQALVRAFGEHRDAIMGAYRDADHGRRLQLLTELHRVAPGQAVPHVVAALVDKPRHAHQIHGIGYRPYFVGLCELLDGQAWHEHADALHARLEAEDDAIVRERLAGFLDPRARSDAEPSAPEVGYDFEGFSAATAAAVVDAIAAHRGGPPIVQIDLEHGEFSLHVEAVNVRRSGGGAPHRWPVSAYAAAVPSDREDADGDEIVVALREALDLGDADLSWSETASLLDLLWTRALLLAGQGLAAFLPASDVAVADDCVVRLVTHDDASGLDTLASIDGWVAGTLRKLGLPQPRLRALAQGLFSTDSERAWLLALAATPP